MAYPNDCTKYIVCVSSKENVYTCPDGTSWNQAKTTCDNNNEENCGTTYTKGQLNLNSSQPDLDLDFFKC